MVTANYPIFVTLVEPTIELLKVRVAEKLEEIRVNYDGLLVITITRDGLIFHHVQDDEIQTKSSSTFEGHLPANLFSGEQGTGLLRMRPDLFVIYDLAELIEAGISKEDIYAITRLNRLGTGLILGYSRQPRDSVSDRSILFADLFIEALRSDRDELIDRAVELISSDWN